MSSGAVSPQPPLGDRLALSAKETRTQQPSLALPLSSLHSSAPDWFQARKD